MITPADPAAIRARLEALLAQFDDVDERERQLERDLVIARAQRAEVARVERQIARVYQLEREIDDLRRALAIAIDERNRAEVRVAELEAALDAARDGIDARIPAGRRRTLPRRVRPAETITLAAGRRV